jgi:hypothetical protein
MSELASVQVRSIEKAHVQRIYTIRLSRQAAVDSVLGADRLLEALAEYPGDMLTTALVEGSNGQVCGMFLDDSGNELVACLIGWDKRVVT